MYTRKSARILKEMPVNDDPPQTNNIVVAESKTALKSIDKATSDVSVATVAEAEVLKHPSVLEKTTFVITTKPLPVQQSNICDASVSKESVDVTKLDDVYGVHFKPSGNVVSTGSFEEAKLILGQLPVHVTAGCAVVIKQFASMDELNNFRTSMKAKTDGVKEGKIRAVPAIIHGGQPDSGYALKRSNLKRAENEIAVGFDDIPEVNVITGKTPTKEASSSNDDQSADGVLINQSPAAKRMRSVIRTKGMKLIIHYWPGVPTAAVAQIVFIDIIDTRQDFTHWLQRPEKWVDVFGNIQQECENTTNPLGKFFTQMRSAHFRAPSGDNVAQTKIVKGSDGGSKLTLHRQGLYTYLPNGQNSDSIREHIKRNMARVLNDYDIQVCYRMIMTETSRNNRIPDLLNPCQAGSGGVFWDQLQGAVDGMEFIPHASLNEVFLNNDVINITKSLFQGITDQMFTSGALPADIDGFAHGSSV